MIQNIPIKIMLVDDHIVLRDALANLLNKSEDIHVLQSAANGKECIDLVTKGIVPDVLIHRGHSYYAYKTIEKTKPTTKIFVLGSCGGYHSLSSIIDKAADVNIISSKQIGVQGVNNPLLKILADTIREGKDVEWQKIWKSLDAKLKGTDAYNRFLDYILKLLQLRPFRIGIIFNGAFRRRAAS